MRLSLALICFLQISVSANSFSQSKKVDLNYRDISVETLFQEIQRQTGYNFVFNYEELGNKTIPSVSYTDATVETVLKDILSGMGHTFTFENNVIVVQAVRASVQQQTYVIRGKITDAAGAPLTGVTVSVDGTTTATMTDANGQFIFRVPASTGMLKITYVGFKEQRIAYKSDVEVSVKMQEAVSEIEEVQIIAYGSRSKRDLINSISSVNAEEMKELPTDNILSMLQGRMAGVQITSQGGAPGAGGSSMIIRGLSSIEDSNLGGSDGSPLYVIDGVPMYSFVSPTTGSNALADLDPSMVESVEVLKDASSAGIYGSRAGNGVVLITTKRGKSGEANFSANVSYSVSHLPETPLQLLGSAERNNALTMFRNYKSTSAAYDYRYPTSYVDAYGNPTYEYDYFWASGTTEDRSMPILQDSLNEYNNNQTNWWKKFFRTAKVLNANVQASGGSDKFTYMISGGIYNEEGININSDFTRASMLMNLGATPNKNIKIDARVHLSYTDKSRNKRNNVFAAQSKYEGLSANPAGASSLDPADGTALTADMDRFFATIIKNDNYRMMSNLRLALNLYKGLKFTTNLGLDFSQANQNVFEPKSVASTTDGNNSAGIISRNITISNENLLTYDTRINDTHYIDALLGLSYTGDEAHYLAGQAYRLASDQIQYVPGESRGVTDGLADQRYQSNFEKKAMISYFGRVAYNFDRRYLVEFSFRRDGSSVFGEKVRWANFPTVAAGWVFTDETFMKDLNWLDLGKLRATWGKSGQIFNKPYLAHGLMGEAYSWSLGTSVHPSSIINQYLTWEKTDQYNIGLDLDMFDYRAKFKFDYYYKDTKGLLVDVSLPGNFLGTNSQVRNAKGVSNEGIEMEAIVDIFRVSEVKWRLKFNIARNWNRFRNSYNNEDLDGQVLGLPLYNIMVYHDDGFYQSADEIPYIYKPDGTKVLQSTNSVPNDVGMRKILDLNGDGEITYADMYYAGSTMPAATGGLTNELRWKNFDLSVLFTFSISRKIINNYTYSSINPTTMRMMPLFADVRNNTFWRKSGDNTDYPEQRFYGSNRTQYTAQFRSLVENVHYARLKQLTLGYNVPKSFSQKLSLSDVRIFFTGENLLLLHNYSGLDPEVVSMKDGIDNLESYPLARKWTIGLTVKF